MPFPYPAEQKTRLMHRDEPSIAKPDQLQAVLARLSTVLEHAFGAVATDAALDAPSQIDAEWSPPPLSDAVLQELQFSAHRSSSDVLYEVVDGRAQALDPGILLAEGTRLSLNTYPNSFYEHYWSRHAPLDRLTLRLFGSGAAIVEVHRLMPDGSSYQVGRQRAELERERGATVTVALDPSPAGSGRLYFEIVAPVETVILAGQIETDTAPRQPVRLGIGLCTFNREPMLLANLKRLVQSRYYRWAAPQVVIVNQGRPFALPDMTALLAAERGRITVIEQPNFGGAGGFTRAAMEIVRGAECSHVLFMDDDIEFDPAVLSTTHAFAARTIQPTVIGGAMLDLFRPTIMYEAGAVIASNNILRGVLHETRLDDVETIDKLAREIPCHFNGWWYCAIPSELFRQHGLPLPIFIRGDDMEYGVRLTTRGIPTVSLPPVAVWHEPFYAKPPSWQLYYDLRNRLIFASCYPDFVRLDSMMVVLRRLIDSLLKHDYMHAELIIRALEDFLVGPSLLDTPMDTLHREISALAAQNAPLKPASTVGMTKAPYRAPPSGMARQASLLRGLVDLYRGKVGGRMRPDLVHYDEWHPWMTMGVSQYALTDRMLSYLHVYRYDRARLRSLLWRGLRVIRRYRNEVGRVREEWRVAHPDLTSWERWDGILGLGAKSREPAPEPVRWPAQAAS